MSVALTNVGSSPSLETCSPRRRPRVVALLIALTVCWSCSGDATDVPEDTAARDVFIAAYLDLRVAALSLGTADIEGDVRDSILAVYGVTGEELVEFIDMHGENVEFMQDLWTEIEGQLSERLEQNVRDEENEELEDD